MRSKSIMKVVDEDDLEIQEFLSNPTPLDFSGVKAIVYMRDIDMVVKKKDGSPMLAYKDECTKFMAGKFAINPKAPIIMRDVRMIMPNGKVLLGNITR